MPVVHQIDREREGQFCLETVPVVHQIEIKIWFLNYYDTTTSINKYISYSI